MNPDNLYDMWSLQSGPDSEWISIYYNENNNNKYNITSLFNIVWSNNTSWEKKIIKKSLYMYMSKLFTFGS